MANKKRKKNNGVLLVRLFSIGVILFFIGILVGLWFSSSSFKVMAASISAPKFASEAMAILDSALVDTQCAYKSYAKRHFIQCSREGMSLANHGYWKSSSGLWEAEKRKEPVRFVRGNKSGVSERRNNEDFISFRIHPVDEKAIYLTRYLLDPQLVGPPSHVADINSIRLGKRQQAKKVKSPSK